MAVNIRKVMESRVTGEFLTELRNGRVTNTKDWKDRLLVLDDLYKGNFTRVFPNEDYESDLPHVMNLVQVGMEDLSRLVTEARPSVKQFPKDDSTDAQKRAFLQEAVAETYWDVNDGDILSPRLAMDLAGAGAAFIVIDTSDKIYPCFHRIDPRFAYPDVSNGQLLDLLVVQNMQVRMAAQLFPRLNLREVPAHIADEVEVIEYYSAGECVQAVGLLKGSSLVPGGMTIVKRWNPGVGMPPVAFAQLPSYDGDFRGMFDQIRGVLNTKNRIIRQLLDYTDRLTYAPKVSKGLLNSEVEEGPDAHYRLDPNVAEASMGRLAPAGPAPQLFTILEILEREQRGGTSYPAQRQGEVSQSIASASFVNSTMGQLTTSVRNLQTLLGSIRERALRVAGMLDQKHMDFEKPLARSVGKKHSYTPSRALGEDFLPRVNFGAGAGMDRMSADVRVLQHLGAGLISHETARKQIDYLDKDSEEQDRIEHEMARGAIAQKFLAEAPWQEVAKVSELMDTGVSLSQAVAQVMKQQQPMPGAEGAMPGGPPPMGGPPGQSPGMEQLALEKGATQDQAPFPTEPLQNVMVAPNR